MSGSLLKNATSQLLILTFDLIAHIIKSSDIQGSAPMAELSALFKRNTCNILQVMDCKFASPASDMWGVGVISYLLVSGGLSPFWAGNRYRTMAKTLRKIHSFFLAVTFESKKRFHKGLLMLSRFLGNKWTFTINLS